MVVGEKMRPDPSQKGHNDHRPLTPGGKGRIVGLDLPGQEVAMRRFIAIVLASLLVFAGTLPTSAAAKSTGTITGVAKATSGQPLGGHSVLVRSVRTGDVVATATTSATGSFVVPSLDPGSYVVEIVDTAGRIVGTSAIATVVEGRIASLMVTAASTELVGGQNAALIAIVVAAGAAAVIGIVVATTGDEASPSQ
jgi:hypothetical protein